MRMCAGQANDESSIRSGLRSRYLRHYRGRDDVLVIDELGLAHAQSRIDIAVFNGHLHGYEIKSANDTLNRLPRQLGFYRSTLQKLTLVVATRHLEAVSVIAPHWCGLMEVIEGKRGGVTFAKRRPATMNKNLDPYMLAHLLWLPEAREILRARGAALSELNGSRKQLYRILADELTVRELASEIKSAMSSRIVWRGRPPRL